MEKYMGVPVRKSLDVKFIIEDQLSLLKTYHDFVIPETLKVGVVVPTGKPRWIAQLLTQLKTQTYKPNQILLLTHGYSENELEMLNGLISQLALPVTVINDDSDTNVGTRTNSLVDLVEADVVLRMDDDDLYFPYYIEYKLKSLLKQNVSLTGNKTIITRDAKDGITGLYIPEYPVYGHCIAGTLTFWKDEYLRVGGMTTHRQRSATFFQEELLRKGGTVASSDMFNYIIMRNLDDGHLTPFTTIYSKFNQIDRYEIGVIS